MTGALGALPREPAAWEAYALALDADARWALGDAMAREWIEGRLEPRLMAEIGAGTRDAAALTSLRRHLSRALAACGAEDLEIESRGGQIDESTARRWCWITSWVLLSQDEDLFLMDDHLVVPLLEEATAGCPKRDYVLAIVQHHVRDQIHASLRGGADAVRARIRELVRFRPAAVAAGHTALEAYLGRLEGYERPAKVKQEEASARIADVWRCHAPPRVDLEPLSGGKWRAQTSAHAGHEEWIVVDQKTGAMHLEAKKKKS